MNNEIKKIHKIVNLDGVNISYSYQPKLKFGPNISIIFLSGYMSDMFGTKANYLDKLSREIGFEYLRFDYSGHGMSQGKVEDQTLSSWIKQARFFINKKLNYPVIIIGSSLGGWISLVISKKPNKKVKGLIGIGVAPDFTEDILKNLTLQQKRTYKKINYLSIKSTYSKDKYIFTKKFLKDSEKNFVLKKNINTFSYVTLLYGTLDTSVTIQKQIKTLELLRSKSAKLVIVQDSDHRMSSPKNLILIKSEVKNMIKDIL